MLDHILQKRGPKRWPPQFFTGQAGCYCCVSSGKAYHYGGTIGSSPPIVATNVEYDTGANSWTSKTSMSSARSNMASGVVSGKAYAAFGINGAFARQQGLFEYVVDSWTTKTSGPSPARTLPSGCGDATDLYVTGGADGTATLRDNDAWNQSGNSWTAKTDISTPDRNQHATGRIGGYIYLFGGTQTSTGNLVDTDRYDISGDSYSAKTDLPSPARRLWCAASNLDDKLYCMGGSDGSYYQDTDEYVDDTWTTRANNTASRLVSVSATVAAASAIYAYGGLAASGNVANNEQYVVDTYTSKTGLSTGTSLGGGCSI